MTKPDGNEKTDPQKVGVRRNEITIGLCENKEADRIFLDKYWMQRIRRSRRISYAADFLLTRIAWIQCADPFGTKLAKPLQSFDINDAIELCRGFFIEDTPNYVESCAISKVLRNVVNDWYKKYGIVKKIAIVYQDIDVGQKGVVYKALGFRSYGECNRARHYLEATRGDSHGKKIIWAKALSPINGSHYDIKMPN